MRRELNAYEAQEVDALQRLLLALLKKDKNTVRVRELRAAVQSFKAPTLRPMPHRDDVKRLRTRILELNPHAATYPQWGPY
jgi:hypothetical protein